MSVNKNQKFSYEVEPLPGGRKIVNINGRQELRKVWKAKETGVCTIQYKNNPHEVKIEMINNTEVITLV
jgi:hypothetical protein